MVFQTIPDFPRTRDRFPMILLDNNTYSQKNKPLLPPPLKQLENLLILPVKVSNKQRLLTHNRYQEELLLTLIQPLVMCSIVIVIYNKVTS